MQPTIHTKYPRARRRRWLNQLMAAAFTAVLMALLPTGATAQKVISLDIQGSINPSTSSYIKAGLKEAIRSRSPLLLIHLNAERGLLRSVDAIRKQFYQAKLPIIVYIAPATARIHLAGLQLASAATLSAMAPGAIIISADTQSSADSQNAASMQLKDTSIYRAISASQAYGKKWIDLMAKSDQDLLHQLDGKSVALIDGVQVLNTKNASIVKMEMSYSQRLMNRLSDPTTVYVILVLGFMGLLFELFSPGAVFPGIIGGICLCLSFYSFNYLPVNYIGLSLMIIGIIFYFLELKITSYGILAICGTLALLMGSHLLFEARPAENILPLNWGVVIMVSVVAGLFFLFLVYKGLKAQKLQPVTGGNALVGLVAISLDLLDPKGQVQVLGEIWSAVAVGPPIPKGQKVIIKKVEELTLYVASP